MTKASLDSNYWNNRYEGNEMGWNIGYANSIHVDYVLEHCKPDSRILIPGAGKAYEAAALYKKGYKNVFALDFAPEVKEIFLEENPDFPENQYLVEDFFEHNETYDVILEQTFFCAIHPSLRSQYTEHVYHLLKEGGLLYGVLFNFEKLDGPPFGGTKKEYRALFQEKFNILKLEQSVNSIPERAEKELLLEILKK